MEATTDRRLTGIDRLAADFRDIVIPGGADDPDNFFAPEDQLAALQDAVQACPGYAAEQTAMLRPRANQMAAALVLLYTSQAYGDAIPEHIQASLNQGTGDRILVVDSDTFLALRKTLYGPRHAESSRQVDRRWVEDERNAWGAEMIPQGHIVLVRDLSEYSWSPDENGVVSIADPSNRAHNPLQPVNGQRLAAAERYALKAVTEEVVHLFLDAALPVAVQEIIAKAITADLLVRTGNGDAVDGILQRCRDYRDQLESTFGAGYHTLARLGFDNLPLGPSPRMQLIEQIERDARMEDLLGEKYQDLFQIR